MKIKGLDHIAVAAERIMDLDGLLGDLLGLQRLGTEEAAGQKVRLGIYRLGGTRIEVLEPSAPGSPIKGFLEKRGGGLHHIALEVEDIEDAIGEFKEKGYRLIDETPREGAGGTRIAFVHPRSSGGLLIELVERP